jgi:inhibitor of KinA sporulation pathway (predicted exonuclease)
MLAAAGPKTKLDFRGIFRGPVPVRRLGMSGIRSATPNGSRCRLLDDVDPVALVRHVCPAASRVECDPPWSTREDDRLHNSAARPIDNR